MTEAEAFQVAKEFVVAHAIEVTALSTVRFISASQIQETIMQFPKLKIGGDPRWIFIFDESPETDERVEASSGTIVEVNDSNGQAKICMTL